MFSDCYLMGSGKYFRTMYILSAIDNALCEAARVDGASRWQ